MWHVDEIEDWQRSGEDSVWLSVCFSPYLIAVRIIYLMLNINLKTLTDNMQ